MTEILLIGSRQNKYDATDTGGITILFELLIKELKKKEISFKVIDMLVANNGGKIKTLFSVNYQILKNIRTVNHLSFHGAENNFLFITPLVLILAKLFNKTVSIRFFAGDFGIKYKNRNFIQKAIIRLILKHTDFLFFELKHLVTEFKVYNPNTYWFPNVRDKEIQRISNKIFSKRFVYIGSINQEKGIDELCIAIKQLPPEAICDIYGPIKDKSEKYSKEYFKRLGVNYKGSLKVDEVLSVMSQYDVLILPSYREGYPGVIIEAFSQGLPVIATKLLGIMEMCEHNYNALLIEVGSSEQLLDAMQNITYESYIKLHENAKKSFLNFNSAVQTDLFLKRINYQSINKGKLCVE